MSALSDFLEGKRGPLVWIEPAGYAAKAFAGGDADWMADTSSVVANLSQANAALKSAVLTVDLSALLLGDALTPDADDPLSAAEDLLESDAVIRSAQDIAKAAEHTLGGRVDLVLGLPSPATLLRRCGAAGDEPLGFDDMDDAGAALANFLRQFSEQKFSGIMLRSEASEAEAEDELDTLGAIVSTARHYRWHSMLRVDGGMAPSTAAEASVDLLLLPQLPPGAFANGFSDGGTRLGGGLSAAFWQGEDFSELGSDALLYGDAPGDIEPEAVLARAATLPR
ncbi:MAG: hypothetical protein CMN28_03930 [Salinisphaeraceae bacterium]|nr:hypothetical protein [Salinisphaeraceae bacterium]